MGEILTDAETAELEQLQDEVIAKSGPNKGRPKATATAEDVVRLEELQVKAAQAENAETETETAETETPETETETDAEDETDGDAETDEEPGLLERMGMIEKRIDKIEAALKKNGIIKHSRYLSAKGQAVNG